MRSPLPGARPNYDSDESALRRCEALVNYWIRREGRQYGPFTQERLRAEVRGGGLRLADEWRTDAMTEWLAVSELVVSGLSVSGPASESDLSLSWNEGTPQTPEPVQASAEAPPPQAKHAEQVQPETKREPPRIPEFNTTGNVVVESLATGAAICALMLFGAFRLIAADSRTETEAVIVAALFCGALAFWLQFFHLKRLVRLGKYSRRVPVLGSFMAASPGTRRMAFARGLAAFLVALVGLAALGLLREQWWQRLLAALGTGVWFFFRNLRDQKPSSSKSLLGPSTVLPLFLAVVVGGALLGVLGLFLGSEKAPPQVSALAATGGPPTRAADLSKAPARETDDTGTAGGAPRQAPPPTIAAESRTQSEAATRQAIVEGIASDIHKSVPFASRVGTEVVNVEAAPNTLVWTMKADGISQAAFRDDPDTFRAWAEQNFKPVACGEKEYCKRLGLRDDFSVRYSFVDKRGAPLFSIRVRLADCK